MYSVGDVEHGPEDTCGCLIGQALQRLDADPNVLDTFDRLTPTDFFADLFNADAPDTVYWQVIWLDHVQAHQDNRYTWGRAVDVADHTGISQTNPDKLLKELI